MKKSMLIVVTLILTATLLVGCGQAATPIPPTAVPTEAATACPTFPPTAVVTACPTAAPAPAPTLVTVIGKIKSSPYNLTEDIITAHSTELQFHDPWIGTSGADAMEKGILLKDLITLVSPKKSAKTIGLVGSDGTEYDIPIADAQQYNIMLVHWVSGTVLDAAGGGPVKVAYPAEATTYTSDSWAWWVTVIIFK
jgi:hypothetical protein